MFDTELFATVTSGLVTVGADVAAAHIDTRLAELNWHVCPVACSAVTDKEQLISAVADALSFPDWTSRNWDAFSDAMTDLSWLQQQRVALVLHDTAALGDAAPDAWRVGRDSLNEAVEWWTDRSRALLVVVH